MRSIKESIRSFCDDDEIKDESTKFMPARPAHCLAVEKMIVKILDDVEFAIDFWPKIPAFLEVEAADEAGVEKGLRMLSIEENVGNLSVVDVYKKYGLDIHSFRELKFE